MRSQWPVPSVQGTGEAVCSLVTADVEGGTVLLGTAGRGLTHFRAAEARKLAVALNEAADEVDGPDPQLDANATLLEALRAFIASETDR